MPRKSTDTTDDFQSRYFRLLEEKVTDNASRLDHHERLLDRIGSFVERDNERLNTVWDRLFGADDKRKSELPPFIDDPRVRKAIGWIALAVLILAAAAVNFDLRGLI